MNLLHISGYRFFLRHPAQLTLSLIGIAMGVAVIVAVDIAQKSAQQAFSFSMEQVSGRATHSIRCYPETCPDSLYKKIRSDIGFRSSAPIVDQYISIANDKDLSNSRTMRILGLDPFADNPFRDYLRTMQSAAADLGKFIISANGILLSPTTAQSLGKTEGDRVTALVSGKKIPLKILSLLPQSEKSSALENLILTDISTAKEIFSMGTRLDRIDLMVSSKRDQDKLKQIAASLPGNAFIEKTGTASKDAQTITSAFRLNLMAMSLLSIVVGGFLIFNTLSFSVVQRREMMGLFRAMGVTRKEIFRKIMLEALLFGLVGSILGIALGELMSGSFIKIILNTINNLYFTLSVEKVETPLSSYIIGFILGIAVSLAAAFIPAQEVTRYSPGVTMHRSSSIQDVLARVPLFSLAGLAALLLALLALLIPGRYILPGFVGLFAMIIGLSLLTPWSTVKLVSLLNRFLKNINNFHIRIGIQNIIRNMNRTGLAIASLAIAISVTIGVGTMIESFRYTVVDWLGSRLSADIFVTVPGNMRRQRNNTLPYELAAKIEKIRGVQEISVFRQVEVPSSVGKIFLRAIRVGERTKKKKYFNKKKFDNAQTWKLLESKPVAVISETLAYKKNLKLGDRVTLFSPSGKIDFEIIAIYNDYSSDRGQITLSDTLYRKIWQDDRVSGVSVYLQNLANTKIEAERIKKEIRKLGGKERALLVQSQKSLMNFSIEVFDRTFLITYVLQFIAIVVSFIAILSSLMALQLERKKELGMMRAIGLKKEEIRLQVFSQSLVTGLIAGLLSLPLGNALSYVLIEVINRRSFGWNFPFIFQADLNLYALLLAVFSAFLASIYPALRMANTPVYEALRDE